MFCAILRLVGCAFGLSKAITDEGIWNENDGGLKQSAQKKKKRGEIDGRGVHGRRHVSTGTAPCVEKMGDFVGIAVS